jgi:transposase
VRFAQQSENKITLGHLPTYAPELNPDEQVWNHAKARLAKRFIDSKEAMKRSMLNIMRSIQKNVSLVQSFCKLEITTYAVI